MTGTGTVLDPYIIFTVADLQAIADDLSAYYELSGDIDASATSGWNGGLGFAPIAYFTGQLDGKGYTVTGLFINRITTEASIGLFGLVSGNPTIKNLTLATVNITGRGIVGALIAQNRGATISNCHVSGAVSVVESGSATYCNVGGISGYVDKSATLIEDSSSSATISATDTSTSFKTIKAGGLIGYIYVPAPIIRDSYATGAVTVSGVRQWAYAGGFVGHDVSGGTINRCYATGNASATVTTASSTMRASAGGFVGETGADTSATNCYARGNASATAPSGTGYAYAGGFAGYIGTATNCYATGTTTTSGGATLVEGGFCAAGDTITNCFWDTETSGDATSAGGTGKTTAQMKTEATFTAASWDFAGIWFINGVTNNSYPFLSGAIVGPADTVARVTQLIHRYNRMAGQYLLEIAIGEVDVNISVPYTEVGTRSSSILKEQVEPTKKVETKKEVEAKVETYIEKYIRLSGFGRPLKETYVEKYIRLSGYGKP